MIVNKFDEIQYIFFLLRYSFGKAIEVKKVVDESNFLLTERIDVVLNSFQKLIKKLKRKLSRVNKSTIT